MTRRAAAGQGVTYTGSTGKSGRPAGSPGESTASGVGQGVSEDPSTEQLPEPSHSTLRKPPPQAYSGTTLQLRGTATCPRSHASDTDTTPSVQ